MFVTRLVAVEAYLRVEYQTDTPLFRERGDLLLGRRALRIPLPALDDEPASPGQDSNDTIAITEGGFTPTKVQPEPEPETMAALEVVSDGQSN